MMKLRCVAFGLTAMLAWAAVAQAQYQSVGGPERGGYRPGQINPQVHSDRPDSRYRYGSRYQSDSRYRSPTDSRYQPTYQSGPTHPHGPVQAEPQYSYRFGQRGHLARLAAALERQANDVCWEMHRNYKRNRNWDENYRLMYQILQDAKHVRELVREQYRGAENQDHIADDLHDMDRLFDRVQRRVARWEPDHGPRSLPVADVRDLRDPRSGHRPTPGTELEARMQRLDDTLGHLMVDYGVRTRLEERATGRFEFGGYDAPAPR